MGLFVDLLHVPEAVTNDALEGIYKAMSDGHDHGDGIWEPHDSPLVQRLIELFTQRGLDRLETVHQQLLAWQAGAHHKPGASHVPPPAGTLQRWTPDELALARLYLESLPPAQWTLSDHMLCIEFVVQTYLPADQLVAEADWLTTKAAMMGKVQANLAGHALTLKQADKVLAAMPSSFALGVPLNALAQAVLGYSQARTAENVRALSDSVRHQLRALVIADVEQRMLGNQAGSSLQTKLFDTFAALNRDWRRIAINEAGEAQTQGYIASLPLGAKVKRVEQYRGACAFCRKIDGRIVTIVAPDDPKKDPDTTIWVGKNNVGRSASPRKRVGDLLVEREPHEMWTIPAGLVHPHCRGRWVPVAEAAPGDDPVFAEQLRAILGG